MADEAHVRAEAAVAELADLVADLRGGGFMERGRILARGARILRGLTPRQRRTLAIEVARGAAPQLVERITAEGGAAGDVDLSPAQVKAVFDMIARLDEEGAGNLASTLRDPGWQRDALGLLATDGLDAVAASAGLDEVEELLTPQTLEEYEQHEEYEEHEEPLGHQDDETHAHEEGDDHAPAPEPDADGTSTLEERRAAQAAAAHATQSPEARAERAAATRAAQDQAEVAPDFAAPPAAYAATMPELATYEASGIDESLLSFGAATPPPRPLASEPVRSPEPQDVATDDAERSWFGGGDLGIAPLEPAHTPLAERLVAVERPSHRLRLVGDQIEAVAAMGPEEQAAVLLALPDGWVRRRALHRLLEAHGISQASAPRLLQTLGHDIDRAWVAASLIEAGIVRLDDVAPALSARAHARLHGRYRHTEV